MTRHWLQKRGITWLCGAVILLLWAVPGRADYTVIDTNQTACYDNDVEILCPNLGDAFYGQDSQYTSTVPQYQDNGDGTVTDLSTGLMWQKTPDQDGDGDLDSDDKLSFDDAVAAAPGCQLAGYVDWRLPTIKELYSLMDFNGVDPSGASGTPPDLVPFIDTDYFDFVYGDEGTGERLIDAQYWSSTEYVSTTMGGDATAFGVNFADGRIKGYPSEPVGPPGEEFLMTSFVRFVRGNPSYGSNAFVDNGDGTVTDEATGLMWMKTDSGEGMAWEDALVYAESLEYAGYSDWRLPDAKELQSIVDYTRSPDTTGSAAIDPVFNVTAIIDEGGTTNYPFYWTGTTHINISDYPGTFAAYVCFGEALGWMQPPGGGSYILMDVHGAGAQRSDPKSGDPGSYPYGHGPQGDVVRITNYVRCVRSAEPGPDPTPTPGECLNHGDVTLDGMHTATDAQLAFLIALGSYSPSFEEACAADCSGDGSVTAGDAQTIFLAVLGSGQCADPL
ncbi:MAG TPA: DUF1566 domain-containing protein [bacterium]|nr:DUF1566 domain-containing protein [bacterium]